MSGGDIADMISHLLGNWVCGKLLMAQSIGH